MKGAIILANVCIRTVILYLLIVLLMRLTGKRQIGQLELTELVTAFMISEIAATPISDNAIPLLYGVIPAVLLVCLEVFLSYASVKSSRFRKLVAGTPITLIREGKPDMAQMNLARITVEELASAVRCAGISRLSDVSYAVLEPSGTVSVIPKAAASPPSADSLGVSVGENGMEHAIIVDGNLDKTELFKVGRNQAWLTDQLEKAGFSSPGEVFYLGLDDSGEVCVFGKDGKNGKNGKNEKKGKDGKGS